MRSFGGNPIQASTTKINLNESEDISTNKIAHEKYIVRHLMSGRILYASRSNDTVQLDTFSRDSPNKPVLFECVDSTLTQGALVNFNVKLSSGMSKGKKEVQVLNLCAKKIRKKDKKNINKMSQNIDSSESIEQEDLKDSDPIQETYESYFEKEELMLSNDSSEHGFRIYKVDQ